jgi:nicotinamide riboside kinase
MLAEKLAAHFGAPWVPEYARQFWDEHGAIGLEDIPAIARRQWALEDAAVRAATTGQCHLIDDTPSGRATGSSETCNPLDYKPSGAARLLICDTEALTTVLWSEVLYLTCPPDIKREAEKRARNYALYLLLNVDMPWAPDPQRCFPDPADREKYLRLWRGALERRHLPFVEIRGDWAAREHAAIAAVADLLGIDAPGHRHP